MTEMSEDQVEELFSALLERPLPERASLLQSMCRGDQALRDRLEALLEAHDRVGGFLGGAAPTAAPSGPDAAEGRRIGSYQVRRRIAAGGMGIVFQAVQDHPHRVVALKLLKEGIASRQTLQRFRHEAEILGQLKHANIAQIFDTGTVDEGQGEQPYFVMEYIDGQPLTASSEAKGLSTDERLTLFAKVCDAVQHAHLRGVIHRDLKPDNILVDERARRRSSTSAWPARTQTWQLRRCSTDIGQLIGTVPYMSPEQVTGDPNQVWTRDRTCTALGVVLYELLAGCLPHKLEESERSPKRHRTSFARKIRPG